MNSASQPAPDANPHAAHAAAKWEPVPQQAITDPYFSVVENQPSGPVQEVAAKGFSPSTPPNVSPIAQNADGQFLVPAGATVQIDGNEGYDYIDLSDRDIASVSFGQSSISICDAVSGEKFIIEYRNVRFAMFACGQLIELP